MVERALHLIGQDASECVGWDRPPAASAEAPATRCVKALRGIFIESSQRRRAVRFRNAHVDQNTVPNHLLVNEPPLSAQGIGGSCGQ
jgi:hypothetical protein